MIMKTGRRYAGIINAIEEEIMKLKDIKAIEQIGEKELEIDVDKLYEIIVKSSLATCYNDSSGETEEASRELAQTIAKKCPIEVKEK